MAGTRLAAALLALALAACSADGGGSTADPAPTGPTGTPTAGSASPTPPGGPGSATPSAGATGAGPGATASAAPSSARPTGAGTTAPGTRMTAVGSYAYTQEGSENLGGTPRELPATMTVRVRRGLTADSRVMEAPYSPDRSDTFTLRYAGRRVEVLRTDSYVRFGTYEQRRTLVPEPPVVALPADTRVGTRASGRFAGSDGSGRWELEVVRHERLRVAGRPVDTVVVDLGVYLESGPVTGSVRSVTYWDPTRVLPIRQRTDTDLRQGVTTYTSSVTIMLARLP